MELKAYGSNIEKLFYVSPNADPRSIKVELEGAKDAKVKESGELILKTELGDIEFTKPVAYQEVDGKRVYVPVSYRLFKDGEKLAYAFEVGEYDRSKELVIDPLLRATYLGGSGEDVANAIAVNGSYIYVAGWTTSSGFPGVSVGYQNSYGGDSDAFVAKLNSTLGVVHATYLGGNQTDKALGIKVADYIYVVGFTNSNGTLGFSNSLNGTAGDAFVAKYDNLTSYAPPSGGGGGGGGGEDATTNGTTNGTATGNGTSQTVETPAGQVQVSVSGGTFTQAPQVVDVPTPPAGLTAPYGGISFTAQLSQAGGTITVTVTIQGTIPQGAKLYKLINNNYVEVLGVAFAGNTVTFQVQDGSQFDADGQVNGAVRDPFVLAVPASTGGGDTGGGSGGAGTTSGGGGGGCSMSFGASPINALFYLLLPFLVALRRFARK